SPPERSWRRSWRTWTGSTSSTERRARRWRSVTRSPSSLGSRRFGRDERRWRGSRSPWRRAGFEVLAARRRDSGGWRARMTKVAIGACAMLSLALSSAGARAVEPALTTQVVATGLTKPLLVTHAPGDYARIFIVEQNGKIKIVKNGTLLPT